MDLDPPAFSFGLSLRSRVLLLVGLALAPAFGLVAYYGWEARRSAETEARRQTRQVALVVANDLATVFVALETLSISVYALTGILRTRPSAPPPSTSTTTAPIRR